MNLDLGRLEIIGLVLCIGAILLVVLVVFAARALFGNRNRQAVDRDEDSIRREQGQERPRYDSEQVQSRGGFGNTPPTGQRARRRESGGFGLPTTGRRGLDSDPQSRGDRLKEYRRRQGRGSGRPSEPGDDDDVSSRGGFGGG